MSLKDNKWTLTKETKLHIQNGDKKVVYCEEYIKEAVKELKSRFELLKEEDFSMYVAVISVINDVLGDFEK